MKTLKYLAVVLLTAVFASCGGPKDGKKELKINNAEVLGDSADIVSIVDGTYTLVGTVPTDMTQTIMIKLKLRLEKPVKDNGFTIHGWKVNLLDENGTTLLGGFLSGLQLKEEEESKLKKFLTTGEVGDEEEFTFSDNIGNDELYKNIMDKTANLCLTDVTLSVSSDTIIDTSDSSSDTDEEVEDGDDDGDGDYDDLLSSYEEFVDEYISLLKKAQDGDMDAVTEYATCMQKAQELGEKIAKAQGNMSAEQWARYTKLLNKFTKSIK